VEVGKSEPAVVGQTGSAWGNTFGQFKRDREPEKAEGDKRSPVGFWRIGSSFGFAASPRPGHLVLKTGETVCVRPFCRLPDRSRQ
jgi:hypothetical protein